MNAICKKLKPVRLVFSRSVIKEMISILPSDALYFLSVSFHVNKKMQENNTEDWMELKKIIELELDHRNKNNSALELL